MGCHRASLARYLRIHCWGCTNLLRVDGLLDLRSDVVRYTSLDRCSGRD